MDKEPSIKQQRYLNNLVDMVENGGALDDLNKKEAALDAGYSMAVATNTKQKIEKRPSFQKLLDKSFKIKDIRNKLQDGLDAQIVKTATFKGSITDQKSFPDYQTRLKYIELLMQLKGELSGSLEYQRRANEEGLPGEQGGIDEPQQRINILRQDIKVYLGFPDQGEAQTVIG